MIRPLSWLGSCFRPQNGCTASHREQRTEAGDKASRTLCAQLHEPAAPAQRHGALLAEAGCTPSQGQPSPDIWGPTGGCLEPANQGPAARTRARRVLDFNAMDSRSTTITFARSTASSEAGDACSTSSGQLGVVHGCNPMQTPHDMLQSILTALVPIRAPSPEHFKRAETEPRTLSEPGALPTLLPVHDIGMYAPSLSCDISCLRTSAAVATPTHFRHQLSTLPRLETCRYEAPRTPSAAYAQQHKLVNVFSEPILSPLDDTTATPCYQPGPTSLMFNTPSAAAAANTRLATPFTGAPAVPAIRTPTPAADNRLLSPCTPRTRCPSQVDLMTFGDWSPTAPDAICEIRATAGAAAAEATTKEPHWVMLMHSAFPTGSADLTPRMGCPAVDPLGQHMVLRGHHEVGVILSEGQADTLGSVWGSVVTTIEEMEAASS